MFLCVMLSLTPERAPKAGPATCFVFYTKHMENTRVKRWDHDVPLLLAPEIRLDKMDQSNWMYIF